MASEPGVLYVQEIFVSGQWMPYTQYAEPFVLAFDSSSEAYKEMQSAESFRIAKYVRQED